MKKTKRIGKWFVCAINDNHLFYKYDIQMWFPFVSLMIMWKPTHMNTREIEHKIFVQMYWKSSCITIFKFHIGRIINPKYESMYHGN